MSIPPIVKGRGAQFNPANRFERIQVDREILDRFPADEGDTVDDGAERRGPTTEFYRDHTRSILTENDSPDVGFRTSINPYRGCEHGCIYCYARPTHEYLGLSGGLDFESRIFVKEDAPELLRKKLSSPRWVPEAISLSGVTDCYQPVERRLQLTRRCLAVLQEFRNPFTVITKNHLVTRDLDLIEPMARLDGAAVFLSVTTLDAGLCSILEPRTSRPAFRLEAIRKLAEAGVPVGVMVAPVIPGLTDHELPAILKAAREAGATQAGFVPLRLPHSVLPLFTDWLEQHAPERKDKVLNRIRSIRGGKLNDSQFGSRMRGEGPFAEQLKQMFRLMVRKLGLNEKPLGLTAAHFQRPKDSKIGDPQLSLF